MAEQHKTMEEIRAGIYPKPPETLVEKLADKLASDAGYHTITIGTRQEYEIEAEEILDFIEKNRDQ